MGFIHYKEMNIQFLRTINFYRKYIANEKRNDLFIRRNDFCYNNQEYLLVSAICNLPYIQLIILYGDGKKVNKAYIIIDNCYFSIARLEAEKEIKVIRKYNGQLSNSRKSEIPYYRTSFSNETLKCIRELLNICKINRGKKNNLVDDYYLDYIEFCNYIDERRNDISNYAIKKLVKSYKSEDEVGNSELYI